ncbi:hypothetical protein C8R43DRAFT_954152 [Mycena crocata]|nr:hypothetical protein C8R43DRAFT_954152 [Mycena crocata]
MNERIKQGLGRKSGERKLVLSACPESPRLDTPSKFPGSDTNLFYRAPTPSLGEPLPQLLSRSPSPNLPSAAAAVATVFGSRAPTPMYLPPPADLLHGLSVDLFVDPRDVGMPPPPSPFIRAPSRINSVSLQSDVGVTLVKHPPQRKRSRPKSPRTALTSSASRVHAGYNILPPAKRQRTNILPDAVARYIDIEAQEDGRRTWRRMSKEVTTLSTTMSRTTNIRAFLLISWNGTITISTTLGFSKNSLPAMHHGTRRRLILIQPLIPLRRGINVTSRRPDPALWTIHARYGRENELIQSIMGRVYVEATTICFSKISPEIHTSSKNLQPVPLHARPELLRFTRHAASRSCDDPDYVGRWARWTKGNHKATWCMCPKGTNVYLSLAFRWARYRMIGSLPPCLIQKQCLEHIPTKTYGNEREYTWQGNIYQNGLRLSPWTYGDLTILDVLPTEAELKLFSDSQSTCWNSLIFWPTILNNWLLGKAIAFVRVNQVSSTLEDGSMEHDERALPVCNLRRHLLSPLPPLAIDDRVIVVAGAQQGLMGYVDGIDKIHPSLCGALSPRPPRWRRPERIAAALIPPALQSKEDTLLLIPMKCLQREFSGLLSGILPDKESDLQKPTELRNPAIYQPWSKPRRNRNAETPKDVNLDFTGLEIRVTKGQLKECSKGSCQLRFKPSRSTQDINMDVMLTVRLENRPKLDQIPGHYVHELSSERTILRLAIFHVPLYLIYSSRTRSRHYQRQMQNQSEEFSAISHPASRLWVRGFRLSLFPDTPPSPTLILAAAKSIPVHPRPPSPKISPQDIRDQGKYCQWLLDKRLRHKRLDIRIEGLEQSNLFSKLGKKAQQQEGALGILVIQNTLRNIDTLLRCIKPMRTILRPPFERRKTPLIEVQTRVVVIGPDTSGSSSKIGEYAQTVPGETNDVVKVVFSGSVDRNVESGYYDMHSLCRSVNESMEWNSFPIDTTSFP